MTPVVSTIATRSHLALAHCMARSFLAHHPDGEVVVLLVDDPGRAVSVFADLPVTALSVADLGIVELDTMRARYSTFELCNALKPFLLAHQLATHDVGRVLYLDSDIWVTDSLGPDVFTPLERAAVFLTPHLFTIPEPGRGFVDRDLAVVLRGTLNGGCVGVRRGADAERFLAWWSERVARAGYYRLDQGMNCDQRWLDLALGFDLDLVVSRHPGLNVAYWNLDERTVSRADGRWLSNGEPLRFVHFSGFDPDDPTALTRNWSRFDLVNRPDIAGVAQEYRAALRSSIELVADAARRRRVIGARPVRPVQPPFAPEPAPGEPADAAIDLSFVIPVRDGAATLADAVRSALDQEGARIEVVVVDDGSRDDPASVLPPDDRVSLISQSPGGVSRARNRGLAAARGRVVVFLDADDTVTDPRRARDELALLDRQPGLAIVHSGWEVAERGTTLATRTPWTRLPTLDLEHWVDYPVVLPSAMAFRRDCVRDIGGFDPSLDQLEDLDLVLRLLLRGWGATWLERVTTRYRRRDDSASTDVDAQAAAVAVVLDRLFSDPAAPAGLVARQRPTRYNLHVWLASRYHRVGRSREMAAHLAASCVWADRPIASLPLDWVERFADARADAGDPALDVRALAADPAWRGLLASSAGALLERGMAVTGSVTPRRADGAGDGPGPSGIWARAVPVGRAPEPALDLAAAWARDYGRHRSGWSAALEALRPLHVDGGVAVDGFVEHTFIGSRRPPHTAPWVGFLHNPPDLPPWYPIDQSAPRLLADERFQSSLAHCRGLFTLSTALRDWWAARVDVPVEAVPLPTAAPDRRFRIEGFHHNPFPRVVQLGSWLRKLHAIHELPVRHLQRTLVHQHEAYVDALFAAERDALHLRVDSSLVETLPFLDDHAFDELLSCNLVFVDLYAASANNTVVECLARATPILVNPLPAVREYLGDDYPLYFVSRTEAAQLAEDPDRVAAAHEHLAACPQAARLDGACFVGAVAGSEIYRGLTSAAPVT